MWMLILIPQKAASKGSEIEKVLSYHIQQKCSLRIASTSNYYDFSRRLKNESDAIQPRVVEVFQIQKKLESERGNMKVDLMREKEE